MILAAAQTKPKRGDIEANLSNHYDFITLAKENGAQLIVFPELSITGYEREDAARLAFTKNDTLLNHLKKLATDTNSTIIAGAPIQLDSKLFLGAFCIEPKNQVSIYTKQFLHNGEETYYQSSFNFNPQLQIENERISCAICADIDNKKHPENASLKKSTTYIASIFFSPNGIANAHTSLQQYASQYQMNVLMANFCGDSYGYPSGGRSAFWNNKGELIAQMNDSREGLLLVEKKDESWISKILNT